MDHLLLQNTYPWIYKLSNQFIIHRFEWSEIFLLEEHNYQGEKLQIQKYKNHQDCEKAHSKEFQRC